ncbi:putative L-PSP endoribonuclease family protein [Pseudovirgaria hyperparasitica]|uniref:Putative L-PSP endoribonuclease family protein n=1 Tax=Pseudovirgaria hyperparasitica TaxID=470096 RepID=A0A6A6VTE6_9PEZI|nr:putative L-PSP endoribonuclease family protein [Pseudovirgaria hyperparasitica]KAF2753066.1 putative L-PSP endoribonuclease family protein [Pseudovirgaria hyperparasitica]
MSNLQSYDYPGWGTFARQSMSFTQAVRVGDRLVISGQGGWDPHNPDPSLDHSFIPGSLADEIHQAFANVEVALKHAGGTGWDQVYKVVTYSTDIPSQTDLIVGELRKWMPGHAAVWTEVGVKELGSPAMHFEIEVESWLGEGSK